ncbi:hypothetical protein, partial [Bergeriella denitrificans]|uniref:hypothetical protein n=1 Tax=Bergeriella denitrificans TaxID=494 RepID=UPI001C3F9DB2
MPDKSLSHLNILGIDTKRRARMPDLQILMYRKRIRTSTHYRAKVPAYGLQFIGTISFDLMGLMNGTALLSPCHTIVGELNFCHSVGSP